MTTITSIHHRELESIRSGFWDYMALHADEFELDRIYHTWIPLLSTYVTHDSIEVLIDDWYAMITHSSLWVDYIEKAQEKATRPFILHILEQWKKPFIFAGRRADSGMYLNWSSGQEWQLSKVKNRFVIGLALPLLEKKEALLVHSFEAGPDLFDLLEEGFHMSSFSSKQDYLNEDYLSCLSFLSDNK